MDNKTVFERASKGAEAATSNTGILSGDIYRTLLMVEGKATVGEICKRAAPSLRDFIKPLLQDLLKNEFIHDADKPFISTLIIPKKIQKPAEEESDGEELYFTMAFRSPTPEVLAAEAEAEKVRVQEAAAEKAKAEAAARLKAEQAATERKAKEAAGKEAKAAAGRKAAEEKRLAEEAKVKEVARLEAEKKAKLAAQ